MKKWFAAVLFLMVLAGGLSAQAHTVSAGLSGGFGIPVVGYAGVNASYEYQIIPQLSVGANVFIEYFPLMLFVVSFTQDPNQLFAVAFEGQAHWYPFSKTFHVDAGFGWGYYAGMSVLILTPGAGWKIDIGKPGGFSINPGARLEIFMPLGKNIFQNSDQNSNLIPVNLNLNLSVGYSF